MNINIRPIRQDEILETAVIYVDCWRNDYKLFVPNDVLDSFDVQKEADECKEWLNEECDDIRLLYGAFINEYMVGYVAASQNCEEPIEYETEVNGFFVRKEYRGLGIGMKLLYTMADKLTVKGYTSMLVYNFRDSSSNSYYRSLGGTLVKQEVQQCGKRELAVDVFGWQLNDLIAILNQRTQKHK